jgi:tRNA(Arg) A34 adenosine deaminase TadA
MRSQDVFQYSLAAALGLHLVYSIKKARDDKKVDKVTIVLPDWVADFEKELKDKEFATDEKMMAIAIELSAKNVAANTGGPFGCAIFEKDVASGKTKLFACGVNLVVPLNNSTLHGEMVAIQFAQKKLSTFSMKQGGASGKQYIMCSSCEPCAMCLGGTLWSGVSKLVTSATKADAEAIGFNEGPVFDESYVQLEEAGCAVQRNVLREAGARVLQKYGKTGVIYNSDGS